MAENRGGSKNCTVLVVGASGFIGRSIARKLLHEGHRVLALGRPDSKRLSAIPGGCKLFCGFIHRNDKAFRQAIEEADAVIYAAGTVRGRRLTDFLPGNVDGLSTLARELSGTKSAGFPLLALSSLAATRPELSFYAWSKREGECALSKYRDLDWTIFRPPAVYGPGDREMLPLFQLMKRGLAPALGPPGQRLSLLHVDDLANAVTLWLLSPESTRHRIFDLDDGAGDGYDLHQMMEAIPRKGRIYKLRMPAALLHLMAGGNLLLSRILGYSPMLTPGKIREIRHPRWVCRNEPLTEALGWRPRITLKEGVSKLL